MTDRTRRALGLSLIAASVLVGLGLQLGGVQMATFDRVYSSGTTAAFAGKLHWSVNVLLITLVAGVWLLVSRRGNTRPNKITGANHGQR